MRALLVNPWIYDFKAFDFWNKPVGLLITAALMREYGFEITLIDCLDRNHPLLPGGSKTDVYGRGKYWSEPIPKPPLFGRMPRQYKRYGLPIDIFRQLLVEAPEPDIALVTSSMTYWYPGVFETIRLLKSRFPRTPVVLGGIYAALCTEHAKQNSGADFVVTGPAETELPKVLQALGLLKPGTEPRYSLPDYSLYPKLDYVVVLTSRGCPFACTYCAIHMLVPQLRFYDPQLVIESIARWSELKGVRNISFFDDALLTNPHLPAILEGVTTLGRGLKLHSSNGLQARSITPKLASLMKSAGFETIYLSLETTYHERQIKTGGKVITADFTAAIDTLLTSNFKRDQIHVYLLAGLPGQSDDEVLESIDFCQKLGIKINLTEYSPIPGTATYRETGLDLDTDPLYHNNTYFTWYHPEPRLDFLAAAKKQLGSPSASP